jgi:hypothetical protein
MRLVVLLVSVSFAVASEGAAQTPAGPGDAWPHVLTRAVFSAAGDFIRSTEPDLPLEVSFRGDVDLVDFGAIRIPFDFSFDVAFNDQFNPRFADYSFRFAPAVPLGRAELSALYAHTSRHLHDAERPGSISWNSFGGRVAADWGSGRRRWHGRVDASYYPESRRRYVDYEWDVVEAGRVSYRVSPRWAYYGDAALRLVGCDPSVAGRDSVWGGRVEAGLILGYRGGTGEAYVAWDRRIDPVPTSHTVVDFFVVGGRFLISR